VNNQADTSGKQILFISGCTCESTCSQRVSIREEKCCVGLLCRLATIPVRNHGRSLVCCPRQVVCEILSTLWQAARETARFVSPKPSTFPEASKTHCSPQDQVFCYTVSPNSKQRKCCEEIVCLTPAGS